MSPFWFFFSKENTGCVIYRADMYSVADKGSNWIQLDFERANRISMWLWNTQIKSIQDKENMIFWQSKWQTVLSLSPHVCDYIAVTPSSSIMSVYVVHVQVQHLSSTWHACLCCSTTTWLPLDYLSLFLFILPVRLFKYAIYILVWMTGFFPSAVVRLEAQLRWMCHLIMSCVVYWSPAASLQEKENTRCLSS